MRGEKGWGCTPGHNPFLHTPLGPKNTGLFMLAFLTSRRTRTMPTNRATAAIVGVAHRMYSNPNTFRITKNSMMSREPLCSRDSRKGSRSANSDFSSASFLIVIRPFFFSHLAVLNNSEKKPNRLYHEKAAERETFISLDVQGTSECYTVALKFWVAIGRRKMWALTTLYVGKTSRSWIFATNNWMIPLKLSTFCAIIYHVICQQNTGQLRGVSMKISYKKLWVMLIQRDIAKVTLRQDLGLAAGTMSKLNKGEEVALSILLRICAYLDCDIGDICEAVHETRE